MNQMKYQTLLAWKCHLLQILNNALGIKVQIWKSLQDQRS